MQQLRYYWNYTSWRANWNERAPVILFFGNLKLRWILAGLDAIIALKLVELGTCEREALASGEGRSDGEMRGGGESGKWGEVSVSSNGWNWVGNRSHLLSPSSTASESRDRIRILCGNLQVANGKSCHSYYATLHLTLKKLINIANLTMSLIRLIYLLFHFHL